MGRRGWHASHLEPVLAEEASGKTPDNATASLIGGSTAPDRRIWRARQARMIATVERSTVTGKIMESLGERLDHWSVEASLDPDARWVITLAHPASAGVIIETGATDEAEAVAVSSRVLAASTEIDIASAAPDLAHADLMSGLRTIAKAFEWDSREVRAVAFLMCEHDRLSLDEAAWRAGYEGIDAPMTAVSPLA